MQKPFTTKIIKLMAAHSDGAAAYASAMVWDYKRRLTIKELNEVWSDIPCAFCERYQKERKEIECPLYKIFGDCCHYDDNINIWQKANNALLAKDQQAFTTAANDLYFLIRSIIDDLYKLPKKCGSCNYWNMELNGTCSKSGRDHFRSHRFDDKACKEWEAVPGTDVKPEPKKEVFYHIGQKFVRDNNKYILTEVSLHEVQMINLRGTSLWASRMKVKNSGNITETEFEQICGGCTFTLIEDKKETK